MTSIFCVLSINIIVQVYFFQKLSFFESVNPQLDKRLFIEFPEKYKLTTCYGQILFFMSKQKNNFCTQRVVNLYFSGNSMNNLLSYCGLADARMGASDTDLHVIFFNLSF